MKGRRRERESEREGEGMTMDGERRKTRKREKGKGMMTRGTTTVKRYRETSPPSLTFWPFLPLHSVCQTTTTEQPSN